MTAVAAVLVGLGVLVVVVAAWGALLPATTRGRLHFLTPVTSLGAPLTGIGLAVGTGWHLSTATILLIVAVLALTGPALGAATGRMSAERDRVVPAEPPE